MVLFALIFATTPLTDVLHEPAHEICVCFFNVGQGQCFFLGDKNKKFAVLIDAGSSGEKFLINVHRGTEGQISASPSDFSPPDLELVRSIRCKIEQYLDANTKLLMISTHGDKDHYNWFDSLLRKGYPVPKRVRTETHFTIPLISDLNPHNILWVLGGYAIDYCKQSGVEAVSGLPDWALTKEFYCSIGLDKDFCVRKRGSISKVGDLIQLPAPNGLKLLCRQKIIAEKQEGKEDYTVIQEIPSAGGADILDVGFCDKIQQAINSHLDAYKNFLKVQVLSASEGGSSDDNTRLNLKGDGEKNKSSIVVRIEYTAIKASGEKLHPISFMITGDAPGDITDAIIAKKLNITDSDKIKALKEKMDKGGDFSHPELELLRELRSTVFLSSHHGSSLDEANNVLWLKTLNPSYIVNSHAITTYGHIHESALERMLRQLSVQHQVPNHPLLFGHDHKILPKLPHSTMVCPDPQYYLYSSHLPVYSNCTQQNICLYIDALKGLHWLIFAAIFLPERQYIAIPTVMGKALDPHSTQTDCSIM